ncbi:YybH family protein [Paenibacillus sp. 481]|uniref:YybH family protein n=1 Tax=Paenibacillus sp. 481 TaxID=2835869 RepID=UPI001E33601B|nr:nuclear transport factor 2 family protein [Paenibacillus sp. 481]UHA71825.1 nuclear transport factor 2 family protein [Paenibacillus sp. 481]
MIQELNRFMKQYEDATNSHCFDNVAELITQGAVYIFSDGTYCGMDAIRAVFNRNWDTIKEETYRIENVQWVSLAEDTAVCVYEFHWQGYEQGVFKQGGGRGTNALVRKDWRWYILHEHLSAHPEPSV